MLTDYASSKGWVVPTNAEGIYLFVGKNTITNTTNSNYNVSITDKCAVLKTGSSVHIQVFDTFTVSKHVTQATFDSLPDTDGNGKIDPKIEVTAYAVQASNFDDPSMAWNSTFGAPATPPETQG